MPTATAGKPGAHPAGVVPTQGRAKGRNVKLKLPDAEWLYLKDVCKEWQIKADDAIRLAAEGKLQLYAFACPDINAAYLRSVGRGETKLEQWKSSTLVFVKPETANKLIREEIDWLDYWTTKDGSNWTGNWAHGAGGARLLPVKREDFVILIAEKKRFEAENTDRSRNQAGSTKSELELTLSIAQQPPNSRANVITRPGIQTMFPEISKDRWRGYFNREQKNGLATCRTDNVDNHPGYDAIRIAQWIANIKGELTLKDAINRVTLGTLVEKISDAPTFAPNAPFGLARNKNKE